MGRPAETWMVAGERAATRRSLPGKPGTAGLDAHDRRGDLILVTWSAGSPWVCVEPQRLVRGWTAWYYLLFPVLLFHSIAAARWICAPPPHPIAAAWSCAIGIAVQQPAPACPGCGADRWSDPCRCGPGGLPLQPLHRAGDGRAAGRRTGLLIAVVIGTLRTGAECRRSRPMARHGQRGTCASWRATR